MKEKKPTAVAPRGKNVVVKFQEAADKPLATAHATFALAPAVNASAVIAAYSSSFGGQDMGSMAEVLSGSIKEVNNGDMKAVEAMLFSQAQALQAMFTDFSRRAQRQDYQSHLESFFRMALKAQNQCRMTLETLATIKNPPVVIARQANINQGGQQQVNNGTAPPPPPRTGEIGKPRTELLEQSDGKRLDFGAAGTPGAANPDLAAVGAVHGPQDSDRQGDVRPQRPQGRSGGRGAKLPQREPGPAQGAS